MSRLTFEEGRHPAGAIDDARFRRPKPNGDDGIVGVIDSGTDPKNSRLQAYVLARENWVQTTQDNDHGSFVVGLIANARAETMETPGSRRRNRRSSNSGAGQ